MKIMKRIMPVITALTIFSAYVYAEDFKSSDEIVNDNMISAEENVLTDASNDMDLTVNVIKQNGNTQNIIYTGPLSGYNNGILMNADFSKSQAFIILDWDNPNEMYYILPQESENVNISEGNDNLNQNNVETNILSATQSLASDILIDVNLMYDDIYYEKIMIKDKRLSVPL